MAKSTLLSKKQLTSKTYQLILETPAIEIIPGQWILLNLSEEQQIKRAYSIANYHPDFEKGRITLIVKPNPQGESYPLIQELKEGEKLNFQGPFGHFTLQETPNPKIFIGTGTGIVPCYYMAKSNSFSEENHFFFSVSEKADLFYQEKIESLPNTQVHIYLSQDGETEYHHGRIDLEGHSFDEESEFYICGTKEMVDHFSDLLKKRGHHNLFLEKY